VAQQSVTTQMAPHATEVDLVRWFRVQRFVCHEAALMDAHDYSCWLALWAGDNIRYWVPCNSDDQDPQLGLAIIYDDRRRLEERIVRMQDPAAHAYQPRPRLMRAVSNLAVLDDRDGELTVTSTFVLGQIHQGRQRIWLGRTLHTLANVGSTFEIRRKKVMLLDNDEPIPNLNFLV
jgi:3-phenylpropionate/cinnamic acid dioxygenase small subunit